MKLNLTHLGGKDTVTGSCHLLRSGGLNLMIDCGSAQGNDRVVPMEDWPVPPGELDYLFLTHAHIDHIGRVPELIQRGFKGEIIATHATKALLAPMLEDAMSFSDRTKQESAKLLKTLDKLSWGFEYNQTFDLKSGMRFKLGRAGHILGSAFIRLETSDWSVVFSGDLGACDTPILPDPDIPEPCDFLFMEATYGDRLHEDRKERTRRLGDAIASALADGGKIFIPAFALGRTQELLYEIDRLFSDPHLRRQNRTPRIPVFLDSPLGLEITKIYAGLHEYWDREAKDLLDRGDHPIDFPGLYAVKNFKDHLRLLDIPGPAIIIAGSGMCTGGRIADHLKEGLADPRNDIFFVGYQAKGTPGRKIMEGRVRQGRIGAKVHALTGYSAHADRQGLLNWVGSMKEKPGAIKLIHAEPKARQALMRAFNG